jgi:hypothetical protein
MNITEFTFNSLVSEINSKRKVSLGPIQKNMVKSMIENKSTKLSDFSTSRNAKMYKQSWDNVKSDLRKSGIDFYETKEINGNKYDEIIVLK